VSRLRIDVEASAARPLLEAGSIAATAAATGFAD
jgi:hypothetical protein